MVDKNSLALAIDSLKKGNFVVLYDSDKREGEADLIIHASAITSEKTNYLRKNAGGSIVLAIGKEIANELELPFLHDLFRERGIKNTYIKTNYADTPPYTVPVNHVKAHTGVTDNDKALAIKEFSKVFSQKTKQDRKDFFDNNFRTPGHLPICVSKGIENRRGHTELSIELAKRANLDGAVVLCEMLSDGFALPVKDAILFAKKNNLSFVKGEDIYGK
ncbi:MAG: 3,4-dihydroxy-2-butanone-4-phosphate synthase [Candidatus Micrarchaeota archaeon]